MPLFPIRNRKSVIFAGLLFFNIVLISLQIPLGQEPNLLKRAVFSVISPIQNGTVAILRKIGDIWRGYFALRRIQGENKNMKYELFLLRQENNFLKTALRDFRDAKEVQEYLGRVHHSIRVALVIGLDSSNYYKSIVINKGSLSGIKPDMVVLDRYANLVGRTVAPIALSEARVQLITDDQSGTGAYTAGERVMGVLTGDGQGRCLLKYLLATEKNIALGEEVITSGKDEIFPLGIRIGKIASISQDGSLFQRVVVMPYFSFSDLDLVAVIASDLKRDF
jgi:rod shape-determining protein MreC